MGLFSNNKKLCPICGNATPRLFSTKVEDMPICKECAAKVDLPDGTLGNMSIRDFKEYLAYYDANQPLRDMFSAEYRYTFGWIGGAIELDISNRLLRLQSINSAFVMEASDIKSFRILEDRKPLFEGGMDALKCFDTDMIERVNALAPQISQYMIHKREMEFREEMERRRAEREGENDNAVSRTCAYHDLELPVPFQRFHVEIVLEHPYWKNYRWEQGAPTFNTQYPSIEDYLQSYQNMVEELHVLALNLMQIINPDAQEISGNAQSAQIVREVTVTQAAPAIDAVTEIKKYKELLDAGILTEEEFAAKKRQLLGV